MFRVYFLKSTYYSWSTVGLEVNRWITGYTGTSSSWGGTETVRDPYLLCLRPLDTYRSKKLFWLKILIDLPGVNNSLYGICSTPYECRNNPYRFTFYVTPLIIVKTRFGLRITFFSVYSLNISYFLYTSK